MSSASRAATFNEIAVNLRHIEARLNAGLGFAIKRRIRDFEEKVCREKHRQKEHFERRIARLLREVVKFREQRENAKDWAMRYKEEADDALNALRDGQAYARVIGRELEELRNKYADTTG